MLQTGVQAVQATRQGHCNQKPDNNHGQGGNGAEHGQALRKLGEFALRCNTVPAGMLQVRIAECVDMHSKLAVGLASLIQMVTRQPRVDGNEIGAHQGELTKRGEGFHQSLMRLLCHEVVLRAGKRLETDLQLGRRVDDTGMQLIRLSLINTAVLGGGQGMGHLPLHIKQLQVDGSRLGRGAQVLVLIQGRFQLRLGEHPLRLVVEDRTGRQGQGNGDE